MFFKPESEGKRWWSFDENDDTETTAEHPQNLASEEHNALPAARAR
jgi:hypothetical protein